MVLWEIFSFAMQPYYGMIHEEVIKFIKEGNVLNCPDNCPPAVYQLMRSCWHRKPNHRPQFKAIHKALCGMYDELSKHQPPYRVHL